MSTVVYGRLTWTTTPGLCPVPFHPFSLFDVKAQLSKPSSAGDALGPSSETGLYTEHSQETQKTDFGDHEAKVSRPTKRSAVGI